MAADNVRQLLAEALGKDWNDPLPDIGETWGGYWGACPECGPRFHYRSQRDCWLNDHSDHWLYCAEHKVRWCIGSNIFSAWREETEEDWTRHRTMLEQYREIELVEAVCGLPRCLQGHLPQDWDQTGGDQPD